MLCSCLFKNICKFLKPNRFFAAAGIERSANKRVGKSTEISSGDDQKEFSESQKIIIDESITGT